LKCLKLILVSHKPGDPRGWAVLRDINEALRSRLHLDTDIVTIDSLKEDIDLDSTMDVCMLALLLTRGGHYDFIERFARSTGIRFLGKIPNKAVVNAILEIATSLKCGSVSVLYRPAKRPA
jgi:hypothetical protein